MLLCYISALLIVAQWVLFGFDFFPLSLTYLKCAVEAVTVTTLKHGGKTEIKVPAIFTAGFVAGISGFTAVGMP